MPKPIVIDPVILQNLKAEYYALRKDNLDLSDLINRVFCLDACEFLRQFPDNSVDLILTDEPFGIKGKGVITFNHRKDYNLNFDYDAELPAHLLYPWLPEAARILKDNGVIINCGVGSWSTSFEDVCTFAGLQARQQGVWIKTNPPTRVRPGFRSGYEMVWIASKGSLKDRLNKVPQSYLNNWLIEATCPHCETRFPVTWSHHYKLTDGDWAEDVFVAPYKAHSKRIGHPNEKPTWLGAYYLSMLTNEGDLVVDPFMGSGTWSIVQAAKMNRRYVGNDYDQKWVEIVRQQLNNLQRSDLF